MCLCVFFAISFRSFSVIDSSFELLNYFHHEAAKCFSRFQNVQFCYQFENDRNGLFAIFTTGHHRYHQRPRWDAIHLYYFLQKVLML